MELGNRETTKKRMELQELRNYGTLGNDKEMKKKKKKNASSSGTKDTGKSHEIEELRDIGEQESLSLTNPKCCPVVHPLVIGLTRDMRYWRMDTICS